MQIRLHQLQRMLQLNGKSKERKYKNLSSKKNHLQVGKSTPGMSLLEKDYGFLLLAFLLTGVIVLGLSRLTFAKTEKHPTTASTDDEFISDYLSRISLSRRDYYRNVYLKSDAWQRKRYVVLKRDNWRCVYCGEKATQVHHKKYAKWNIGKEPIEWLVSVCQSCHDAQHH